LSASNRQAENESRSLLIIISVNFVRIINLCKDYSLKKNAFADLKFWILRLKCIAVFLR